jgi:hypothetical protein
MMAAGYGLPDQAIGAMVIFGGMGKPEELID